MKEREILQRDILQELIVYNDGLIPALQTVIEELRLENLEDTKEFLNEVINGINWEIEVYNQCAALINEKTTFFDKKLMIRAVKNLGTALNSGNKCEIADCLENDFLPFLNELTLASKMIVG